MNTKKNIINHHENKSQSEREQQVSKELGAGEA